MSKPVYVMRSIAFEMWTVYVMLDRYGQELFRGRGRWCVQCLLENCTSEKHWGLKLDNLTNMELYDLFWYYLELINTASDLKW